MACKAAAKSSEESYKHQVIERPAAGCTTRDRGRPVPSGAVEGSGSAVSDSKVPATVSLAPRRQPLVRRRAEGRPPLRPELRKSLRPNLSLPFLIGRAFKGVCR